MPHLEPDAAGKPRDPHRAGPGTLGHPDPGTAGRVPSTARSGPARGWGWGGDGCHHLVCYRESPSTKLTLCPECPKEPLTDVGGGGWPSSTAPCRQRRRADKGALTVLPGGAQSPQARGVSRAPCPCARRSPRPRGPMLPATCVWPRTRRAPRRSSSPSGYKVSRAEQRPLGGSQLGRAAAPSPISEPCVVICGVVVTNSRDCTAVLKDAPRQGARSSEGPCSTLRLPAPPRPERALMGLSFSRWLRGQPHHASQAQAWSRSLPRSTAASPCPVTSMLTRALRSRGTGTARPSPWEKRSSSGLVGKLRLGAQPEAGWGVRVASPNLGTTPGVWEDLGTVGRGPGAYLLVRGAGSPPNRHPHAAAGQDAAVRLRDVHV